MELSSVMFINKFPKIHKKCQNGVTALNPTNALIATDAITNTVTLDTTLHKPSGKANMYVRFGYVSLTICNHTRGQVLGSMNNYPIDMMHRSQQPTKEGLKENLEEYFRNSKEQHFMNK